MGIQVGLGSLPGADSLVQAGTAAVQEEDSLCLRDTVLRIGLDRDIAAADGLLDVVEAGLRTAAVVVVDIVDNWDRHLHSSLEQILEEAGCRSLEEDNLALEVVRNLGCLPIAAHHRTAAVGRILLRILGSWLRLGIMLIVLEKLEYPGMKHRLERRVQDEGVVIFRGEVLRRLRRRSVIATAPRRAPPHLSLGEVLFIPPLFNRFRSLMITSLRAGSANPS